MASCNRVWLMSVFVALLVISFRISGTECGEVDVVEEASEEWQPPIPLVRGEFPSIAIIKRRGIENEILCEGYLISKKHVLITVRCTSYRNDNNSYTPEELVVSLGVLNTSSTNEEGVVRANVTEIHVHPDYVQSRMIPDANLAILVLSDDITFTDYIRPVRLPAADDVAINSSAVDVVGIGVAYARKTSSRAMNCNRKDIMYPHPSLEFESSLDHSIFMLPAPDHIFCARNIFSSGDAFFVRIDDTWVQYGLINTQVFNTPPPPFVPTTTTVFTNLKAFTNWIAEIIKLSESGAVN